MASKNEFLESIVPGVNIDEGFFKKAYGYSLYDKGFVSLVAERLVESGNKAAIAGYNEWLANYKRGRREALERVAKWMLR